MTAWPEASAGRPERIPTRQRRRGRYGARMLSRAGRILVLLTCGLLVGCASSGLPKYERPLARQSVQRVRTTAYTHTESDHLRHGSRNALGTQLKSGSLKSAAADWSRWPAGTIFRIRETGEIYVVDDYGRALAGTNTIDLYKTSRRAMNAWGVRRVTIENLQWGDVDRSLAILRQRSKYKHVRRMIDQIVDRYAALKRPGPTIYAGTSPEAPEAPEPPQAPRSVAAAKGVPLTPFSMSSSR